MIPDPLAGVSPQTTSQESAPRTDREDAREETQAIDEWLALFTNREEVAWEYARWILEDYVTDWRQINEAIIRRWSESGLLYIKRKVWQAVSQEDS